MSAPITISPKPGSSSAAVAAQQPKALEPSCDELARVNNSTNDAENAAGAAANNSTPSRRRRSRRNRLRASESCMAEFTDEYDFTEDGIIGAGAYAVVRIAHHRRTRQKYAVKVIDKSNARNTREKCMNEARLLNACSGANQKIVKLHDFKEDKDNYYMVFEYVQGGNLQSQLDQAGTLDENEVACVVRDLAEALHYLHSRRIAHRDLKPDNILCERDDFASPCKLADFDLARASNAVANTSMNDMSISCSYQQSPSQANFGGQTPLECRKSTTSNMDSGIDACSPSAAAQSGSPPTAPPATGSWCDAKTSSSSAFDGHATPTQQSVQRRIIDPPMEMTSPVGSPEYMAPEIAQLFILDEQELVDMYYTQACDIWSLGVIAYYALCGYAPFTAVSQDCTNIDCEWNNGGPCQQCQSSLFEEIYYANLRFPEGDWRGISNDVKDLISRCLDSNAESRITAYEILEHPFLRKRAEVELKRHQSVIENAAPGLHSIAEVEVVKSGDEASSSHNNSSNSIVELGNNKHRQQALNPSSNAENTSKSIDDSSTKNEMALQPQDDDFLSGKMNYCCSLTNETLPATGKIQRDARATLDQLEATHQDMIADSQPQAQTVAAYRYNNQHHQVHQSSKIVPGELLENADTGFTDEFDAHMMAVDHGIGFTSPMPIAQPAYYPNGHVQSVNHHHAPVQQSSYANVGSQPIGIPYYPPSHRIANPYECQFE